MESQEKAAGLQEPTLNILWDDLMNALSASISTRLYTDRKRKLSRRVDSIMFILAVAATLLKDLSPWLPPVALALIATLLTFRSDIIRFIQPESELNEIDRLSSFYAAHFTKVEQLYINLRHGNITPQQAFDQLRALREAERGMHTDLNRLCHRFTQAERKAVNDEAERYRKLYVINIDHTDPNIQPTPSSQTEHPTHQEDAPPAQKAE